MGFTRSPASTTNISDLPTKPTIPGIQLQALFDKYSADDVPIIDNLMAELEALTGGSDIGTNAPSVTAANVTDALEENRLIVNGLTTADGQNVKLTGNQIIAGVKTFSSLPTIPETPSADTDAASKGYVDSQSPLTIPNDSIQNIKMATDVKIGSLSALTTTDKTSVTNAINELDAKEIPNNSIGDEKFKTTNNLTTGKNFLINGDLQVWERSDSFTNPTLGDFLADRYQMSVISGGTTSGTFTISKQEFDQNDKPVNSRNFLRWNQTVAGDRTDVRGIYQSIEDLPFKIDGKFITYSIWIRSSVVINADLIFRTNFGSGGSADQQDTLGTIDYTDLNEWVKFTFTIEIDYVGKTFGDDAYCFILSGANGFNEVNNNICTFDIALLKLELGEVATESEPVSPNEAWFSCQRYTYVPDTSSSASVIGQGSAKSTTVAVVTVELPARLRVIPTISLTPSDFRLSDGLVSVVCTSIAVSGSLESKDRITLDCTVASGLTQYRQYKLVPVGVNKKMIIDAEL